MADEPRHRSCLILRGGETETAQRARRRLSFLSAEEVLWVDETESTSGRFDATQPGAVRGLLGGSFTAVVLNAHRQLDPDLLGRCHGFVWGGGVIVLRLPPEDSTPSGERDGLAAHPYETSDVGTRFYDRFQRRLQATELPAPDEMMSLDNQLEGTEEQARVVDRLVELLESPGVVTASLLADRGRGKSSALGLAVRELHRSDDTLRVGVTAGSRDAVAEIFRFATEGAEPDETADVRFVETTELAVGEGEFDVILVDEAAQLPVPTLRKLTKEHAQSDLIFSTTTHGYEGTGRGFTLRFLGWLEDRPRPHRRFELREPIRWDAGDPLEAFVFDALLLDAEPADLDVPIGVDDVEHHRLDRDVLAGNERMLREFFGLLVRAHYRTTPADLRRMLDAPNLELHGLLHDGSVVGATWVAREGELTAPMCEELYRGRRRLLGHALPETFVTNLGHRDAGRLAMRRSVRIAVHPAYRRRGLGTRLVEAVHEAYDPDLFGTLFGATPGIVRFRRSLGYEIVRLGASRGRRAGAPSVAMVRAVSSRAEELVERLRADFARKLSLQLELKRADGALLLDDDLDRVLRSGLPDPGPLGSLRRREEICQYAYGPRTYESAAHVLEPFVRAHRDALEMLEASQRSLLRARVLGRHSWEGTRRRAEMPSVRATMRGLRRALRELLERVDPRLGEALGWRSSD